MTLYSLAHSGIGTPEVAGYLVHSTIGAFFAASGWNKLFNAGRHKDFVGTLEADRVPFVAFNQWWVPAWELVAGAGLALGSHPPVFAAVLLVIMIVAICCEGPQHVAAYRPINGGDRVADWLYLPEVLYAIILVAIVLGV